MEQLGRYQIIDELGRGAMGVVFRALDPSIGREVALKTIRLGEIASAERANQRERLFREARSAGILSHPGIVTIYDTGEQDGVAFIAMEIVRGPTLDRIMASPEPLDPEQMFRILRQNAEALDYAHRKGIVHRDIKPANIMVDEDGAAKIADFGVAKMAALEQLTQVGLIIGTPNYMSPEQIQGKPITGRADQYSLCVIAFEMLTGEKPFIADHLPTLIFKIVSDEPPSAARLNRSLGPEIDAVLRKGLSKLAEERYGACVELVSALESACVRTRGWKTMARGGVLGLPTVSTITPPKSALPPPVPKRAEHAPRKGRLAVPVITVAVLAAGGGWLWQHRDNWIPGINAPAPQAAQASPPVVESAKPVVEEPKPPVEESKPVVEAPKPAAEEPKPEPPKPAPRKQSGPADIEVPVRSQPDTAAVLLDGEEICLTPCVLSARAGRHELSIRKPGFRTSYQALEISKDMADLPVIVLAAAPMTGTILLSTEPADAAIVVDGKPWPRKSPAELKLPPGKHEIGVESNGLRGSRTVELKDGDLHHIKIVLAQ